MNKYYDNEENFDDIIEQIAQYYQVSTRKLERAFYNEIRSNRRNVGD